MPRPTDAVTAIVGADGLEELHMLALAAVRQVPGLISAEFFTQAGLDILAAHAGLTPPLASRRRCTCCLTPQAQARSTTSRA